MDKRLEDIVQTGNSYEVRRLLEMLSQEKNFREDNGYMNYIGTLDRNGNITMGHDNSQTMWEAITDVQNEAYQTKQAGQVQGNVDR